METSIKMLDTGKRRVGGTMSVGEARAHGDTGIGTALNLKGVELTMGFDTMCTTDSPIGRKKNDSDLMYFEYGESDNTGVQLPTWSVRGFADRTVEGDMILLGRLIFMCQTKGYKELFSSQSSTFSDIIAFSKYGEREFNNESVKKVDKINVRIKSMSITQNSAKKGFNYTLNLVETN